MIIMKQYRQHYKKILQKKINFWLFVLVLGNNKMGFLKSVNLFPYNEFWRIRGNQEVSHSFGGLCSVAIFLAILIVVIFKSIEVFSYATITTTSQTETTLVPPMINVTTAQHHQNLQPYMFAISITANNFKSSSPYLPEELQINALYYTQTKVSGNISMTQQYIPLEECTPSHFSRVQNIENDFDNWSLNQFVCLPLNRTFQIGGHAQFSSEYKQILVVVSCKTVQCNTAVDKNILFTTVTLNSIVNPFNGTNPFTYTLNDQTFLFQSEMMVNYKFLLQHNTIYTDNSVLPFEKIEQQKSYKKQQNFHLFAGYDKVPKTYLIISNSGAKTTYRRSYLKLLDAVSYTGGIFQALLGFFFFMNSYGSFVYEMKFASSYFKAKEAFGIGFFSYCKQLAYGALTSAKVKLDWPIVKQRQKLSHIVNNLLDVVYIQHRIVLLEKAVSVLLDKHHMRGINLIYSITPDEANQKYKIHRIRNRLIHFLKEKSKQDDNLNAKSSQNDEIPGLSRLGSKQVGNHSRSIILQQESKQTSNPIKQRKQGITDIFDLFWKEEKKNIGIMDEPLDKLQEGEENQEEIKSLIQNDLKKLAEDELQYNGDYRSKKICQMIDAELWKKVKQLI